MPPTSGVSHVALTVSDMEASADWYVRVFGWTVLAQFTAGEAGSPRILLLDAGSGFAMSLCQPEEDASGDAFDHRRTGLDHLALGVAGAAGLDEWIEHLDALAIAHSPVRNAAPLGRFVTFEDPDGIQLELWANG